MAIAVRAATDADRPWLASALSEHGWLDAARRGVLMRPLDHASLIAELDGRPSGILTYIVTGSACEILVLLATSERQGIGSALVDAIRDLARAAGCTSLWVLTTNDNVDALRFYQRRGFRISAVRMGAVDTARRTLKPAIPDLGAHGIPIRDEIELSQPI